MSINQRIKKAMKAEKITQTDVAEILKLNAAGQSNLSYHLGKKVHVLLRALKVLREETNINLDWVLTGKGEMLIDRDAEELLRAAEGRKFITKEEAEDIVNDRFDELIKQAEQKVIDSEKNARDKGLDID